MWMGERQVVDEDADRVVAWIEANLNGKVERCERQMRWRQAWFVDLRRDGELLPIYVRGDRKEEFQTWPLEYEAGLLQKLHGTGIPVPKIYGICPDPEAVVMERLPGRPGLSNARSEEERVSLLEQLAEHMAAMHSLDIEQFRELGHGMIDPVEEEQWSLSPFMRAGEKFYLKYKDAPNPRMEFVRKWLRSNAPDKPRELTLIHGDPGQFIFEDGKITSMLDFELASFGDPMMDMAAMRLRALHEPMGDISPLFRRYAEITGKPIDPQVLAYQTAMFSAGTALLISPSLEKVKGGIDYPEYISWNIISLLFIVVAIAEVKGVTLERPAPLEGRAPGRWGSNLDVIEQTFGAAAGGNAKVSDEEAYRQGLAKRLVEFERRRERFGRDAEAEYIDDVADLTGTRASDWREADRVLEDYVLTASTSDDEKLLILFHRWCWRQFQMLTGVVSGHADPTETHHLEMWELKLQPVSEILR